MLSIFIMYSTDRTKALNYTLSCLKSMPLYDRCQKIIVADTKIDSVLSDWEYVQVPRVNGKFCWGRMWDAGVCSAKYDKIIYLDSDRLLPKSYLKEVSEKLKDDMFLYTSQHFMMLKELSIENCKEILEHNYPLSLVSEN